MADQSSGLFGGLAQGIDAGARLGLAGRAQNFAEQQAQAEFQIKQRQMDLAAKKQQSEIAKDRLTSAISVFEKLPPASQQLAYDTTIKPLAAQMGYDLSNVPLDEHLKETLSNVNQLFKLNKEGGISDADLEKGLQAEEAAHVGGNKEIFGEVDKLREGVHQKNKDSSENKGSYTFAGYRPGDGQPVFSFSKSPMLVTSGGSQVTGPIETKDQPAKIKQSVSEIDQQIANIQDLKKVLDQVPAGWKGAAEATIGKAAKGNVFAPAAQYADQVPAIAVAFYRQATGDNRINDSDAKDRALPFMPQPGEPQGQKDAKFSQMLAMLNRRKQAQLTGVDQIPWDPSGSATAHLSAPAGQTPAAPPSSASAGSSLSPAAMAFINKQSGTR